MMMKFTPLLFISILLCIAHNQVEAGCSAVRVSGSTYRHEASGRYEMRPSTSTCSGRSVYRQNGGAYYLFYLSTVTAWAIGPVLCQDNATMHVITNATNPEDITADWSELNARKDWFTNARLDVSCDRAFSGCGTVAVINARYNTAVEGRYRVLDKSDMCYGRYSYKHVSQNLYLYATDEWYIDSELCDTSDVITIYARFKDGAFYPENIQSYGQEPGQITDYWTKTQLTVTCPASTGISVKSQFGLTMALTVLSLTRM